MSLHTAKINIMLKNKTPNKTAMISEINDNYPETRPPDEQ
jgi:hypothetical protein